MWLARARRSEIHVALGYFFGLSRRLEAAAAWLEDQAVDAGLSTRDAGDYRVVWQTWPD